jgi:MarR family transcriptional regulator, repressor for mepA
MTETSSRRIRSLELFRSIMQAQRKAAEEWVRERGLTFEQAVVIGYLEQRPGAKQKDIADMSRTTPGNVSLMLKVLEGRGLVERRTEGGDERSKRVYATAAGIELVAGLNEAMAEVDETIFAPLTASEQATLESLLDRVNAALPPYQP